MRDSFLRNGGEHLAIDAIVNDLNIVNAKTRLDLRGSVVAHGDDAICPFEVGRFDRMNPMFVIKRLESAFVRQQSGIMNARMYCSHHGKPRRHESWRQPRVDVHHVCPRGRLGHGYAPRRILCPVRQPGDFGADALVVEGAAEVFGEDIGAAAAANRGKPDGRFSHCRMVSNGKTSWILLVYFSQANPSANETSLQLDTGPSSSSRRVAANPSASRNKSR